MPDKDQVLAKLWEYEPYFREGSGIPLVTVSTQFLREIAELITPKNAKRLTQDEVMSLPSGTMIWRDEINPGEQTLTPVVPQCLEGAWKRFVPNEGEKDCFVFSDGYGPVDMYGIWYWFWDERPTEEQRWEARNA